MARRENRRKAAPTASKRLAKPWRWGVGAFAAAMIVLVVTVVSLVNWSVSRWPDLAARAERASKEGDHATAYRLWKDYNAGPNASHQSWLSQAREALALGRAAEGLRAIERATASNPSNPEPWLLTLEILRVEDRPIEAIRSAWNAYDAVPPPARRGVLRALTLALLADTPDELARTTLQRWVAEDPADLEARVALLRRFAENPRDGDPTRVARIEMLDDLLRRRPESIAAREALLQELIDAGASDRAKTVLQDWPFPERDARYDRIAGRMALDFDRRPDLAADLLKRALVDLPHDWRIHYRLARALSSRGQNEEARREANRVSSLRETLDPDRLAKRLDGDLADLDSQEAMADLAALCQSAGFERLADAWRAEAIRAPNGGFDLHSR